MSLMNTVTLSLKLAFLPRQMVTQIYTTEVVVVVVPFSLVIRSEDILQCIE